MKKLASIEARDISAQSRAPRQASAKKPAKPAGAKQLPIIGWREWLALPALKVDRIKAKIDTGARTSSLHAFQVRKIVERGVPHVEFCVHPVQHRRLPEIRCLAEIIDERSVTSSSGHKQRRFVIVTPVRIGEYEWPIELTLTNRDEMGFRMLLGREALRRRFLVDAGVSFVLSRGQA